MSRSSASPRPEKAIDWPLLIGLGVIVLAACGFFVLCLIKALHA